MCKQDFSEVRHTRVCFVMNSAWDLMHTAWAMEQSIMHVSVHAVWK